MKEGRFLESKNLFHIFAVRVSLKKENPTKFGEFHVTSSVQKFHVFIGNKNQPFQLCRNRRVSPRGGGRHLTLQFSLGAMFTAQALVKGCVRFFWGFYHGVYIVVHMYICIDTVHI